MSLPEGGCSLRPSCCKQLASYIFIQVTAICTTRVPFLPGLAESHLAPAETRAHYFSQRSISCKIQNIQVLFFLFCQQTECDSSLSRMKHMRLVLIGFFLKFISSNFRLIQGLEAVTLTKTATESRTDTHTMPLVLRHEVLRLTGLLLRSKMAESKEEIFLEEKFQQESSHSIFCFLKQGDKFVRLEQHTYIHTYIYTYTYTHTHTHTHTLSLSLS
jgi:hypothetical protein